VRRPGGASVVDDGWTSEVSSGVALAGFLAIVFSGFTLLAAGPLISLDTYFNLSPPPPAWVPFLHVLDRIGQRAVCLPLLAVVVALCWRSQRSWRAVWLSAGSVFALNLVVLILKVGLGRGQPGAANPAFFAGGMAYPSGHTANIVLVYGLAVYLLGRQLQVPRAARIVLWCAVGLLSATMVITSLTLNWHWFADLIAGLLVGGMVLQLTVAVDAAVRPVTLDEGPAASLRGVRARLRRQQEGRSELAEGAGPPPQDAG
jgi:membrane-associated phospholipid phosphatase